jgi:hypothetical protein
MDSKDWWKSGMTKDELARDDAQCRQMTAVRSPGATVVDEDAYNICMGAYGYEKVRKDFVPPK